MEQVIDVLSLAFRCTEKEPNRRLTMRDIVKQLVDANTPSRKQARLAFGHIFVICHFLFSNIIYPSKYRTFRNVKYVYCQGTQLSCVKS